MIRRDEDEVGELGLAGASALVEPVEGLGVGLMVQVDRGEIGRSGRLQSEQLTLLDRVAMHDAQDARDAQGPAGREAVVGGDVAEGQQGCGPGPPDGVGEPAIEPLGSESRQPATD